MEQTDIFIDYPTVVLGVAELNPWPRNYLGHPDDQVEELGESLDTFLQYKPVVVWRCSQNFSFADGSQLHEGLWYILCGHGLWQAALRVGRERLEAKDLSGISIEMAEAILVADNAAPLGGQPDRDKLAALLAQTRQLQAEKPRLAAMLNRLRTQTGLEENGSGPVGQDTAPAVDRAEELRVKWGVEPGQLWQLGRHRLICGDCTDRAVVERVMGGVMAALCVTSPPYNAAKETNLPNNKKYSEYFDNLEWNDWEKLLDEFTKNSLRFSKYIFVNLQFLSGNKASLLNYLIKHIDYLGDIIIWDKVLSEPALNQNTLNPRFEFVFVLSHKGNKSIGTNKFHGTLENLIVINSRQDKTYSSIHKATFPIEYAKHFIGNFSNEKDIIFDPFLGSGTTLIACENLGRQCRAVEISPGYVAVSLERWAQHTGREPILANS